MIAAKFFDVVVGVDIHFVLVPAPPSPSPIPTPLPHPFTGVVFDPVGLIVSAVISAASSVALGKPFTGPVIVNSMPSAQTGTECTNKIVMPHFPMPPGIAWAPIPVAPKPPIPGKPPSPPISSPVPSNDGVIVTGSKTVYFSGNNAARLGSMVMTCAQPVRLPSSTVIAIPKGALVLIGGPPALDFMSALMGLIRTQWVSSKLHALVNRFVRSNRLRNFLHRLVCFFTGHPVDVMTGKVVTDFIDFQLPGYIPFKFERVYYSTSTYEGPLGHGWHHSYDQHIKVEDSYIVFVAEDGREIDFELIGEGETTKEPIEVLELTRLKDEFIIKTKERLKLRFASVGRPDGAFSLVQISDLNGNEITLNYDTSGHLVQIIDSVGRCIELVNDPIGRLVAIRVQSPDGQGSVDVARYQYDENNNLVAVYDAMGNAYRYKYKHHLLVQETDRNGLSFYFEYDGIDEDAWCVRTWGDGGIYDHVLTYDKERHITIVEDSLGAKTVYYGNEFGLVTKIIDACGGETTYQWDKYCRKISETDPNGNKRVYEYDDNGNQILFVDPLGNKTMRKYNELNLEVELIDPLGNSWKKHYDSKGNLIMAEFPDGGRWEAKYDAHGNPVEYTTPIGQKIKVTYNKLGLPLEVNFFNRYVVRNSYDFWGSLVSRVDAQGNGKEFRYDLLGRLIMERNINGNSISLEYDAEGNLVTYREANGFSTYFKYGGYNFLMEEVRADGSSIKYSYDTEGRLISIQNEVGETYKYELDPMGRIFREVNFEGYEKTYVYDRVGNLITKVDGQGRVDEYRYDGLGRVIEKKLHDGLTVTYEYDVFSRISRASNGVNTIAFERDAVGRIIAERYGNETVQYKYDKMGNIIRQRFPSGTEVSFEYDADGFLSCIVLPHGKKAHFEYDASGREIKRILPNGVISEKTYNPDNTIATIALKMPTGREFRRDYVYDQASNVIEIKDSLRGSIRYEYDLNQRLNLVSYSNGKLERFRFDPTGNLIYSDTIGNVEYDDKERTLRYRNVVQRYDDRGNLSEILIEGQGTAKLSYDAESRLISFETPTGKRYRYEYDALGRRLKKVKDDGSLTFKYSRLNLLSEESDGWLIEYIFLPNSFEPFCMITDGKAHYFHVDHVGTPIALTGPDGQISWIGDFHPYGYCETVREAVIENHLRFPGQYHDIESDLHYNFQRYYDPKLGRYISQDPIGIDGGLNLYEYGPNPINYVDPCGLNTFDRLLLVLAITATLANDPAVENELADQVIEFLDEYVEAKRKFEKLLESIEKAAKAKVVRIKHPRPMSQRIPKNLTYRYPLKIGGRTTPVTRSCR